MSGTTLSRRVNEFLGVVLFATALFWLIALATYDPADPVWFFSTGGQEPPANFAGRVGAFLAELSYQGRRVRRVSPARRAGVRWMALLLVPADRSGVHEGGRA